MSGAPVAGIEREAMRQLHARGMSCNEIARELGRSAATVSKHCGEMGLDFRREQTRAATEAHTADLRLWRTQKALKLAELVDAEIAKWTAPHVAFSFGGRDNIYREHQMDEPPTEARLTMARTIGVLIDKQKVLTETGQDSASGASDVDAWLDSLTGGAGH